MNIEKEINETQTILKVIGRIDTTNANEFDSTVQNEIKEGTNLVLDLKGLEYISSAGLRVLLSTHKALTKVNGKLIIRNVNSDVMEVFDITGFSSILTIEE